MYHFEIYTGTGVLGVTPALVLHQLLLVGKVRYEHITPAITTYARACRDMEIKMVVTSL